MQLVAEKQRSAGDGCFPLLDELRKQANDPNRVAVYLDGHPAGVVSRTFLKATYTFPEMILACGVHRPCTSNNESTLFTRWKGEITTMRSMFSACSGSAEALALPGRGLDRQ